MAKKSFKGGLGSLIQDTRIGNEPEPIEEKGTDETDNTPGYELKRMISRLERELKLWRTGKMNVKLFHKTLSEQGLSYNADTNLFEQEE